MKKIGVTLWITAWMLFCSPPPVQAQLIPFLEHHSVSSGFPTNGIYMSASDQDGFIWLAASGGIIRFDGRTTQSFNRFNSPVLEDDITGIRKYAKDTLLFYTNGYIGKYRNYIIYRDINGRFKIEVRPLENLILAGLGPQHPFYSDATHLTKDKISRKDLLEAIQSGFFSGADLQHLYAYIKGSMYYFTNGTYHRFEQKKETLPYDYIFLIEGKFVQIRPGGEFGVFSPGLGMVYKTDPSLDTMLFETSKNGGLVRKLNRPKNSENILTSNDNRILKLTLNSEGYLQLKNIIENIDVSGISNIVYEPIGDRYLLSTFDEGLKIYNVPKFKSIHKNLIVPRKDNYITSIYALNPDTLLTTYGIVDRYGKLIHDLRLEGSMLGSSSILKEGDSMLFQKGKEVYSFHLKRNTTHIIFSCPFRITCFLRSSDGDLWMSGYNEIARQKKDTIEITHPYIKGNENGVILKLKELDPGYIEVLSNIGSFRLNLKTLQTTSNPYFGKLKVLDFLKDKEDIWIAAYGDGIYRWNAGKIYKLPIDQDGNLVFAQNIVYDPQGWFWYSTNNGIVKVCKKDLELFCMNPEAPVSIISYNLRDGLLSNVLYGNGNPSVSLTKEGYIFYPSVKGIVYTNVNDHSKVPFKPAIFIDQIQTTDSVYMGDHISLPNGFKNLSVKISIPYPGSKGNLYTFYKIEGFSETWSPVNQNSIIEVNSLPAGNYKLSIRYSYFDAAMGHSVWVGKSIYIVVQLPFYRKLWFVLLCILLIAGILFLIYRSRVRLLLQRKKELESAIEIRTAELRSSLENYQKNTEQLYRNQQLFDSLFSTVLHDLGSPLRFLGLLTSRLRSKWNTLRQDEIEKDLEALHASTEEASHIAQDMLVWMNAQKEALEFKKETVQLSQFISNHIRIYQWIAEEKGVRVYASIPDNITMAVNPELLGIIIRNLVDNAIKYAPKGTIEITAHESETYIIIEVKDQGKGIPDPYIIELNQGTSPFKIESNGKLGLRLIFELIHSMEGALKFENRKEGGLAVSVKLPVR